MLSACIVGSNVPQSCVNGCIYAQSDAAAARASMSLSLSLDRCLIRRGSCVCTYAREHPHVQVCDALSDSESEHQAGRVLCKSLVSARRLGQQCCEGKRFRGVGMLPRRPQGCHLEGGCDKIALAAVSSKLDQFGSFCFFMKVRKKNSGSQRAVHQTKEQTNSLARGRLQQCLGPQEKLFWPPAVRGCHIPGDAWRMQGARARERERAQLLYCAMSQIHPRTDGV